MHRGADHAEGDGVGANPAAGVLDRERLGYRVQPALRQRRQRRRHLRVGVVDQAGGDVHDVAAAALRQHRGHCGTRNLEEATHVHSRDGVIVLVGVLGERLGDEDPGVVDHGVDPAEPCQRRVDDPLSDARPRDVAGHRQHHRVVALFDGAGVGDHRVSELAVCRHQALADALRGTRDDGDALRVAHCPIPSSL